MYKQNAEKIIKENNAKNIDALLLVFYKAMENLAKNNVKLFNELNMETYIIANGKKLNKEMAENIIVNMQPYHMKWTLDDITKIMKDYNLILDTVNFWTVMNYAYNNYNELFEDDVEKYVKYSKLFIEDKNAKEDKIFTFFTRIMK